MAAPGTRITVVVIDDHPFFRDGVTRGLHNAGDIRVVGAAGDGRIGLDLIRLSIPQTSAELVLGVATIKTYTQRLYEKLGVSDRAAAVAEAMRQGLLD
jgi:DNA-binding NarL/FixJ family response regulator